jgi:hypothetical protein
VEPEWLEPDDPEIDPGSGQPWGDLHRIQVPGKLRPLFPEITPDIEELADHLSTVVQYFEQRGHELRVLFDGLDRLLKPDQFWAVVEQDLRALRKLNVSVVIAGPLSLLYGAGRQVKDYFDRVEYLPPAPLDSSDTGLLMRVLAARGAHELMHADQMRELCLASGGILRDLVSLARSAGFNAFLDNEDWIGPEHVSHAIDQLGRSYHLSLGTNQLQVLHAILDGNGFDPSKPGNLELLVGRQVLERESSYEVHPALARLLRPNA